MKPRGFNQQQFEPMKTHPGFIAPLDQSGGSTPGANTRQTSNIDQKEQVCVLE
jgi:fructose-bisphosphate aldolase class 1